MYSPHSRPEPPRAPSLFPKISLSRKGYPTKHSADAGHPRHTLYFSQLGLFSKPSQPSFSLIQGWIQHAQLSRAYTSLYRAFTALMYRHAALLRDRSNRCASSNSLSPE